MGVRDLTAAIEGVADLMVRRDEPLCAHLPLRVGGPADLWVEVGSIEALQEFTKQARSTQTRWRLHWPFADWLVRDGGLTGAVVRLSGEFERIDMDDQWITLGAAALWSGLPTSLVGGLWDAVRTWPGSVGALLHGPHAAELAELIGVIRVLRGGRIVEISWPEDGGAPPIGETTIVTSVTLRRASASRRWLNAPPAPGTLFADVDHGVVANELQRAGVLGTRLRSWRLSRVEPGTVVHLGAGTFSDLSLLIKGVKVRVEKTRGVTLEPRIPILGTNQKSSHRSLATAQPLRDPS